MWFSICPRCCERGYEILETHSYCVNCNYSPDFSETTQPLIPDWALEAIQEDLPTRSKVGPEISDEMSRLEVEYLKVS